MFLLNGTILGVTCVSPPYQKVSPQIVPFRVSVLAVVTNKVESPIHSYMFAGLASVDAAVLMVMGIRSVGPTHGFTPFQGMFRFPPT